ncbi:hypothetical protein YC2023_069860 [Brassica napus]
MDFIISSKNQNTSCESAPAISAKLENILKIIYKTGLFINIFKRALRELIFAAPDALPCLRVSSSSRKLSTKRVPMVGAINSLYRCLYMLCIYACMCSHYKYVCVV